MTMRSDHQWESNSLRHLQQGSAASIASAPGDAAGPPPALQALQARLPPPHRRRRAVEPAATLRAEVIRELVGCVRGCGVLMVICCAIRTVSHLYDDAIADLVEELDGSYAAVRRVPGEAARAFTCKFDRKCSVARLREYCVWRCREFAQPMTCLEYIRVQKVRPRLRDTDSLSRNLCNLLHRP